MTYNSPDVFVTLDNFKSEILPNFAAHIYIFDNNSNDDYQQKLAKYQNEMITIHFAPDNAGFGHGHNYNIDHCTEEFMLICNPDILVDQESFELLLVQASAQEHAMLAPSVLYPDGSEQYLVRRKLDVFDYILRFIPFGFIKRLFDKRLAYFECRDLTSEMQEVMFVSGCFMLTRRQDLVDVDGFDERFFMYFEDNDLCQKYRHASKKIVYLPEASVVHYYGKEAHKSMKVFKIFISSMIKYFNKWGWKFF